jgi:hypothetical protein
LDTPRNESATVDELRKSIEGLVRARQELRRAGADHRRLALHNQRALYLKRLLLFDSRVILVSVPYQLMR